MKNKLKLIALALLTSLSAFAESHYREVAIESSHANDSIQVWDSGKGEYVWVTRHWTYPYSDDFPGGVGKAKEAVFAPDGYPYWDARVWVWVPLVYNTWWMKPTSVWVPPVLKYTVGYWQTTYVRVNWGETIMEQHYVVSGHFHPYGDDRIQ
jgi:hypothetical protein